MDRQERATYKAAYAVARRLSLSREDAQDVAIDTMLAAWRKGAMGRAGFARKVARDAACTMIRRRAGKRMPTSLDSLIEGEDRQELEPGTTSDQSETETAIWLSSKVSRQRPLVRRLMLGQFLGESLAESAAQADVPYQTAYAALWRARGGLTRR